MLVRRRAMSPHVAAAGSQSSPALLGISFH